MFKNFKLKNKLLLSFFLITTLSTAATTLFSIYYFSHKIHQEATHNMRKHIRVADLIYKNKIMESRNGVSIMAADGGLQILVNFTIRNKINEYLEKSLQKNRDYHQIVVINTQNEILGQANTSNFSELEQLSYQDNELIKQALLRKQAVAATEKIILAQKPLLSISAAAPIPKSSNVVKQNPNTDLTEPEFTGVILVRYLLNSSDVVLNNIKELLDVTAAIYHENTIINAKITNEQTQPIISAELYQQLITGKQKEAEKIDIRAGGQLAEYKVLTDILQQPVGVLGINISAQPYVDTTQHAAQTLILIMILCILIASLLGYLLARSILIPIYQLLTGVKRVTSGDLSHEIMINLKDELGTLAHSFNSMSRQLNDLFNTLEQRIADATRQLQNTLAHMTAIIDNMADGLLVTDTKGRVIRYNPALSAMFPEQKNLQGQPFAALLNPEIADITTRSQQEINATHSVELALTQQRFAKAVATAIIQKDAIDEQEQHYYVGSRYIGTVILIRDITREKEIDRMLKGTVDTLTRVGTALSAENDLTRLLDLCVSEARRLINADAGSLYILEQNVLKFKIIQNRALNLFLNDNSPELAHLKTIELESDFFVAKCAKEKRILIINEEETNVQKEQIDLFVGYPLKQMIVVPLLDRLQNTVGVLQLINPLDPKTGQCVLTDNNQIEIINSLASQTAVAIDNARNYRRIEHKNIAFKRFVPTEFLSRLGHQEIEEVQLGNASQEKMSVLFADIRSFTDISEHLTADETFHFLNEYLHCIGPNISANGGFIDKYIGDAIMALFPGHGINIGYDAVAAAVGMIQQLKVLNNKRLSQQFPPIRIGVGIHTGALTLGIIGFETRLESTVIGDTVNLASRLESLTKKYNIDIAITSDTLSYLITEKPFLIREIDTVRVKGKEDAITFYEVFDADEPIIRNYKQATLFDYQQALISYKEKEWTQALTQFERIAQYAPETDSIVQIYCARCREFLMNPPDENWDGITRLIDK
jgi:class 3 adenylate cyclase/HAMP domain-containing protein